MSRILVDIYKTGNLNSGIGRFSLNFAGALSETGHPGYEIDLLCPRNLSPFGWKGVTLKKVNIAKRLFPFLNGSYDLWHSLYQFPSYLPRRGSKWILTIHDLNFLVEKDQERSSRYLRKLQENINRADALTVISDFTRTQVLEHLDIKGKPIFRIYNGIRVEAFPGAQKPQFLTRDNFFFSLGIITAKKNFHVLLPLLKNFPGHDLVIAGENNTRYAKEILAQADALNLTGRVHLPGKITDPERYWLYKNCKAFLFPSLAEGFGMPVIEAMLLGKPVFTSTFTSLPEIGGEYAYYFRDFDPGHMTEILQKGLDSWYLNEPEKAAAIQAYARKFSWEQCVENYFSVYAEILGH